MGKDMDQPIEVQVIASHASIIAKDLESLCKKIYALPEEVVPIGETEARDKYAVPGSVNAVSDALTPLREAYGTLDRLYDQWQSVRTAILHERTSVEFARKIRADGALARGGQ